jgi:glycosyltransferase involved in cell wall biosynthesis
METSLPILTILTKNRTANLRQCVESLRANTNKFGKEVYLIVADDSDDSIVPQNRSVLEESKLPFSHFDRKFRASFVRDLVLESGCSLDVANFALLPDDPVAMGAVRNFFLLLLAGKRFIMLDDDMKCKFAPIPDKNDEIDHILGPSIEFPTTQILEKECELIDEDFISCHQRLMQEGVVLTVGGSVGDSGVSNSYHFLGDLEFLNRIKSLEAMRTALQHRKILRYTSNPTIVNWICGSGMSMGINAEKLTPPFLPVQRGEDILFGLMLRNCFLERSAYCNYAMLHTAEREANLEEEQKTFPIPNFGEFIIKILYEDNPSSLEEFGLTLKSISSASNFSEYTANLVARWRQRVALKLEIWSLGLPDFIIQEIEKVRTELKNGAPFVTPLGLPLSSFRDRIRQFGDLLLAWPTLYATARNYGL